MNKKNNEKLPKIKVWAGTTAHMSLDTRLHKRLVDLLKLEGFDAEYRGDYSFEDLTNEKMAIVTHHARSAYKYRFTPSQTDAEEIMIDQQTGKISAKVKMFVTAHNHTTEGTLEIGTIKILRCPCFTTFIPYGGSLKLLPHYQTDIGAWFIIVTKEGRIRTQEWLYPSFMYHEEDHRILMAEKSEKSYADPENYDLEEHLKTLLTNAQKVIMVVADLHVGEPYAVLPPTYVYNGMTNNLITTKANDLLFIYWKHLIYMAKNAFKIDEVWVVGDAFSGGNIFEKTRPSAGILEYQPYMVVELFKLLKNP